MTIADTPPARVAPPSGVAVRTGELTVRAPDDLDDAGIVDVLRIMPVGDSITVGYTDAPEWTEPFHFGYRSGLYQRLDSAHPGRFAFVGASPEPWDERFGDPGVDAPIVPLDLRTVGQDHHRGYAGAGTDQIAGNIESWLDEDRPDVVLLMVGINDIEEGSTTRPSAAEDRLTEIVHTVATHEPAPRLVLAAITPYAEPTPAILAYNSFITGTLVPDSRRRGFDIVAVDQYTALLDERGAIDPTLFANGVNHPTAVASDRIANIWFEALDGVFTH